MRRCRGIFGGIAALTLVVAAAGCAKGGKSPTGHAGGGAIVPATDGGASNGDAAVDASGNSGAGTSGSMAGTGGSTAGTGGGKVDAGPLPDHCGNNKKDGDETSIDCGGSCNGCPGGDPCGTARDCDSLACINKICDPATCDDFRQNQDETDVDCGGSACTQDCGTSGGTCVQCGEGGACKVDKDCTTNNCKNGTCVCEKKTCDGNICGADMDDGCGGKLTCNCTLPDVCKSGMCCTPSSCTDLKPMCGTGLADGCGGMIDCNSNCGSLPCKADHTCCVPLKKADCASSCTGSLADGCGGTVACGTAAYSCFGFTPSNFDPAASGITPTTAPTVTLNCGDSTFNGTTVGNFCSQTAPLIVDQGTQVVLVFQSLTIASGAKLLLGGSKPIVIAVFGDATIDGTIDASGATTVAGPGGGGCATGTGANGGHDGSGDKGDAGGGGGGFGTAGGKGGAGDSGPGQSNGGASNGTATLVPLRGGCNGGNGGNAGSGAQGGGAGGAVQLSVAGTLSISATAHLIASGGGGAVGAASEDGGGGGGSGGAILLEGDVVNVASGAKISANGGGGASGNSSNAVDGAVGANAGEGTTQANGGGATKSAGAGGKGAAGSSAATNGGDGACDGGFLCIGSTRGAAGGGGGGGAGRIRVNATTTCTLSGSFSPAVSKSATCP